MSLLERVRASRRLRWALTIVEPVRDVLEPLAGQAADRLRRAPKAATTGERESVLPEALMLAADAGVHRLEGLGGVSRGDRRRRLLDAARRGGVLLIAEPMWPSSRGPGRVRRQAWWEREGDRAGLRLVAQERPLANAPVSLAFRPAGPRARTPPVPRPAPTALPVHIDDDLSLSTSFAWITAALALALRDRGAAVTIEPTGLSPALSRDRDALRALMGPRPAASHASFGWTHYWPQYQRELRGDATLALFAVNYAFEPGTGPADDWLARIAAQPGGLGPISGFCRDVLVDSGVSPDRCDVIPMGTTLPAVTTDRPAVLARARGLRILHVTNTADTTRHGTDVALAGFERFTHEGGAGTLVVRDYGAGSGALADRIEAARASGVDVRYWPVFYADDELARCLGGFDVQLAPFRGEGFGIKLLDALAAGTPLISPLFGGPRDFLDADVAYPLAHDLVAMEAGYDAEQLAFRRPPVWADPLATSVAEALHRAAADPDALRARRQAAVARAAEFTWDRSAAVLIEALGRRLRS